MKYFVFFISIVTSVAVSAQFRNRDIFVEGSAGYSRSGSSTFTTRTFHLAPTVGIMVAEKTAVILGAGWEERRFGSRGSMSKTTFFSAFAGVQQFLSVSDKVCFFVRGTLGYGENRLDPSGNAIFPSNENQLFLRVSPGVMFFPNPRWAVTARAGDLFYGFNAGNGNSNSEFRFEAGVVRLGILYRIPK